MDHVSSWVQAAIDDARSGEIADRSKERPGLSIEARPRGRFGTWRVRSGQRLYQVIWADDDTWTCSCADARTSELPICKHRAFVASIAPESGRALMHPVAMLAPRSSAGASPAPITDVRLYVPEGRSPRVASLLDAEGRVQRSVRPEELRDALTRTRGLQMAEGVREALDGWIDERAWRRRFARFESSVRKHLAGKRAAPSAWARMNAALTCTLRPYQIEGVLFAARERRALLADDMGLGKTIQTIATLVLLRELGERQKALVVCPASLKHQWRREIEAHAPSLRVAVLEGSRTKRREMVRSDRRPDNGGDADVWVLNFATLRTSLGELRALAPTMLIVDEAQRIKNWNTKTAKAVKSLRTDRVLALTGTPLENRLAELHSVMELLDPRALGPLWRLMPEHGLWDERGKVTGVRALELLRRRMGTRWLRRTKADVLDELPERSDQVIHVSMSKAQRAAHAEHEQRAARILAKEYLTHQDTLRLMAEMQSMRMICNGLALYCFAEIQPNLERWSVEKLLEKYPSPKLELAREHILRLLDAGEKVVVFSQWRRMQILLERVLRADLRARDVRCVEFHGGLDGARRARAIAAFHDDPDARIFLSTDAGGVGLNLQEAASTVIHLELPWNPAVFEQRVGRVHRMGQHEKVRVLTLMSNEGLEARVATGLVQKQALFDGLFEGADMLTFDDAEPFVKRMQQLLGVDCREGSEALLTREEAFDAPLADVPDEVPLDLTLPRGTGVRATRTGTEVRIELSGVSDEAWAHLQRFLRAVA